MKILHLADLHLGKQVNYLSMIENQRFVLNEAIDLCKEENIHHIIISGDIYDRSVPSEEAVNLLDEFLSRAILDEKLKIYIISGNHDSRERLACFSSILERQGLFIDNSVNDDLSMIKHVIEEDNLKINLYSLPFIPAGEIRRLIKEENRPEIKCFEDSVKAVIAANEINKEEINIISTHYFVSGTEPTELGGSEIKSSVGTIDQVSYRLFDDFDYVALGHIHRTQHVGRDTVRYAGSILRYSVDEINQDKKFNIINIVDKEHSSVELRDIVPLNEFVALEGTVEELTQNPTEKDNRIVYFRLTDSDYVLNASTRLKTKYPNYAGLVYINIASAVDNVITPSEVESFDDLTMKEQFDQFFLEINGKELDNIQKEVVTQIIDEIEGRN